MDPLTIGTGHSTIRISYGGADFLDLTLHRKFRLPDAVDGKKYNDSIQNGSFPIYSVAQFSSCNKLPDDVKKNGQLMVPIFSEFTTSSRLEL